MNARTFLGSVAAPKPFAISAAAAEMPFVAIVSQRKLSKRNRRANERKQREYEVEGLRRWTE